jgi:hypothetical protein
MAKKASGVDSLMEMPLRKLSANSINAANDTSQTPAPIIRFRWIHLLLLSAQCFDSAGIY